MSRELITWPGGEHVFALPLGQLRRLQEACDAGPNTVLMRLRNGDWRVDDVIEPLRLGLIGGGMPTAEAGPMVTRLIDQHGLQLFVVPAGTVLWRALSGPVDDQPGGATGEAKAAPENGASPASTETAP